jgi:hypothetical protein
MSERYRIRAPNPNISPERTRGQLKQGLNLKSFWLTGTSRLGARLHGFDVLGRGFADSKAVIPFVQDPSGKTFRIIVVLFDRKSKMSLASMRGLRQKVGFG